MPINNVYLEQMTTPKDIVLLSGILLFFMDFQFKISIYFAY